VQTRGPQMNALMGVFVLTLFSLGLRAAEGPRRENTGSTATTEPKGTRPQHDALRICTNSRPADERPNGRICVDAVLPWFTGSRGPSPRKPRENSDNRTEGHTSPTRRSSDLYKLAARG